MPQSPISPLVVGVVIAIIVATVFAWAWAVRRPSASDTENLQAGEKEVVEMEHQERPLVYAAIGASDVEGIGARDPNSESWVSLLARRMPSDTQFVRLGRGGITLNEANKVEIPAAVAARPDLVTMWNCVNDAVRGVPLALYTRDLQQALDRLTCDTEAHVILLNLPDLTVLMPLPDEMHRALVQGGIQQWNRAMSSVAASYNSRVTLVDLFPVSEHVLADPELISADNFHPSSEGYSWLADHVWRVIESEHLLSRQA